jgi:type I restriction enzyme S subunit
LNQSYFRQSVFTLANGAAQPNISNEQINKIPLLLPESSYLNRFNQSLKAQYDKILSNQLENQKLVELRDWLLPMLMNGQVQIN